MGKVHGSLARAGKVKSQTPKVRSSIQRPPPLMAKIGWGLRPEVFLVFSIRVRNVAAQRYIYCFAKNEDELKVIG